MSPSIPVGGDGHGEGRGRPRTIDAGQRDELRRRPAWFPLLPAAASLGVYALLGVVATTESLGPLRFLAWPGLGLVMAGFLAAAHDCFHLSFLGSRRGNRIAGMLWCTPILTNFSAVKVAHMVHHRRTRVEGDSEHRPDFHHTAEYLAFLGSPLATARSAHRSMRLASERHSTPFLRSRRQRREAQQDAVLLMAWLALALGLSAWAPRTMLELYWGPLAFYLPMASAIALPEHYRCGDGPATLPSTRTTISNGLVRMLIWNSNYHVEHHLFPWVPSCNLPRAHRLVRGELRHCSSGYLAFHARVLRDTSRR